LGFESKISGYIASHKMLRDQDSILQIESVINTLPNLENDKWPFLPRDIFTLSKPISKEANPIQISYRSAMVHFSMSVKQIEDNLEEWLKKFEIFFKQIPDVYEANVDLHCLYSTNYRNNNLNYHWKATTDKNGVKNWNYKGDPITKEEMSNPMNYSHSYFTERLKSQVVENMQWLGSQTGNSILITDRISSLKGNYDRHFTRTNRFETKLKGFGIRTSGAIAMLEGDNVEFEFKTDKIRRIEREDNKLEIELVLDLNTSRLINLEIRKPGDNKR